MELERVEFSYELTGVKFLRFFGKFLFVFMIICVVISLSCLVKSGAFFVDEEALLASAWMYFCLAIVSGAIGSACLGLATISHTAAYRRAIMEQKYCFVKKGTFKEENIEKSAQD